MVSPFRNVHGGAGPCCAAAPLQVERAGCAVPHPLHQGMQTPIPVCCQHLPLPSPMNRDAFLKDGVLSTQQHSHGRTSWVSTGISGLLQKNQRPPPSTGLISKGGGHTCNLHGASSSKCAMRVLTAGERRGDGCVRGCSSAGWMLHDDLLDATVAAVPCGSAQAKMSGAL